MLLIFSSAIVPFLICFIVLYGYLKKIDVFSAFISGVKEGYSVIFSIFPTLLGLLTAVYMLRASGAIDMFSHFLSPLLGNLGIPNECTPLVLLKPISGSGGLALGTELMESYGTESYIGNVTSVMLAASETSIYTISIYLAHVNVKGSKALVGTALTADLVAFISSAFFVRVFLYF